MPGFAVGFPAGTLAGDVGIETETGATGDGFDGQDIPGVNGNDVGYEDVNVFGGVGDFALAVDAIDGLDIVAAGAENFGALQLNAPEAGTGGNDEVIAFAVSPGLGDTEAQSFYLEHEGGFGDFSHALGVAADGFWSGRFGGFGCWLHHGIFGNLSVWTKKKAQLSAAPYLIFIDIV